MLLISTRSPVSDLILSYAMLYYLNYLCCLQITTILAKFLLLPVHTFKQATPVNPDKQNEQGLKEASPLNHQRDNEMTALGNGSVVDEDIPHPNKSMEVASAGQQDLFYKMLELVKMMKDVLLSVKEMTSALVKRSSPEPASVKKCFMWKTLASVLDRLFFLVQALIFLICCALFFPKP